MTGTVLESVLTTLEAIANWVVESMGTLTTMFYAEGSLTFYGILAVAGLGISVCLLFLSIIQNFLHFRG